MLNNDNVVIQHKWSFFSPMSLLQFQIHILNRLISFIPMPEPCLFIYSFNAYLWTGPEYSTVKKMETDTNIAKFIFELGRQAISRPKWVCIGCHWLQKEKESGIMRQTRTEIAIINWGWVESDENSLKDRKGPEGKVFERDSSCEKILNMASVLSWYLTTTTSHLRLWLCWSHLMVRKDKD